MYTFKYRTTSAVGNLEIHLEQNGARWEYKLDVSSLISVISIGNTLFVSRPAHDKGGLSLSLS